MRASLDCLHFSVTARLLAMESYYLSDEQGDMHFDNFDAILLASRTAACEIVGSEGGMSMLAAVPLQIFLC